MQYNSSQPKLIIPEYGRNIQKMINYAVSVKNRQERNLVAQAIIQVMGQLNPHLRDVTDFKHKLWDHLFIISDFKLDVDSPYPVPSRETFNTKPAKVRYQNNQIKYRHYGKNVEHIIAKAVEFKEGEEKEYLTSLIANLLKRFYLNWNRDSVSDEVILQHLNEMSKGKLKLKDTSKLSNTSDLLAQSPKKREFREGGGGRRNEGRHRNHRGGRHNNHRRKY